MSTFDGLFEQIIHSEKAAQDRKNLLLELRCKVHIGQEKVKALQQECHDLHKKLKIKLHELSDKELTQKWLTSQVSIFQDQKACLENQMLDLQNTEKSLQEKLHEEMVKLCSEMSEFASNFGLGNVSHIQREEAYSKQLMELLQDQERLRTSLQMYNDKQSVVDKLCAEKESLQKALESVLKKNTDMTSKMCDELQKTASLEEERKSVSTVPQTSLQFLSLKQQLKYEKQKSAELEDLYVHLQAELQNINQNPWQKQEQQRHKSQHKHQQTQQSQRQLVGKCEQPNLEKFNGFSQSQEIAGNEENETKISERTNEVNSMSLDESFSDGDDTLVTFDLTGTLTNSDIFSRRNSNDMSS